MTWSSIEEIDRLLAMLAKLPGDWDEIRPSDVMDWLETIKAMHEADLETQWALQDRD